MAQHDYSIANQGFPAFRSDLNNGLAAIVSNNSGATEPTTMFAHQIWVDTAANPSILKIRNADNDAWITIGSIDQTGDTFTMVNLKASGPVVFNDAGANVDFRVEGDTDANLLFVDASTDRVGIGTNAPGTKLHIQGDHVSSNGLLRLNANAGQRFASLSLFNDTTAKGFLTHDNTDNLIDLYASASQGLRFTTNDTERMRITSDGIVQIGQSGAIFGQNINHTNSGTQRFINFEFAGNQIGAITGNNTNATYATSSDYRLKENVAPMAGALATVAQLQPCTWSWKSNGSNGQGFIAHELQEVCPDAVTGEKDATEIKQVEVSPAIPATYDEDGNELTPAVQAVYEEREVPAYQGVDTSFLVATLTAAIQELSAKNDALEARIAALEGV